MSKEEIIKWNELEIKAGDRVYLCDIGWHLVLKIQDNEMFVFPVYYGDIKIDKPYTIDVSHICEVMKASYKTIFPMEEDNDDT